MTTETLGAKAIPAWSPFQSAIFDEIEKGSGSLVVHAVAGSGKTTTLVEIGKRIPRGRSAVALAFNKTMGETLQARMPYWIQSKTFHSHCYEALKASLPKAPRVNFKKTGDHFKKVAKSDSDFYKHVSSLTKLVGYAKASGVGALGDPFDYWAPQLYELIDYFDVDTEDADKLVFYTMLTCQASNNDLTSVDFDDMLYLTLLRNVPFTRCDFVLVDEAQDLNGVQRELLGRMIKQDFVKVPGMPIEIDALTYEYTGRLIAVGDPHQSIYGFRGADSDGMARITEDFNAKVLPLSVSYRCSQAVVAEANRVLNS